MLWVRYRRPPTATGQVMKYCPDLLRVQDLVGCQRCCLPLYKSTILPPWKDPVRRSCFVNSVIKGSNIKYWNKVPYTRMTRIHFLFHAYATRSRDMNLPHVEAHAYDVHLATEAWQVTFRYSCRDQTGILSTRSDLPRTGIEQGYLQNTQSRHCGR